MTTPSNGASTLRLSFACCSTLICACWAATFKQSFGLPPHRYHTSRRIEHAKTLLAKPALSVTDIGMRVGFSETSSFTAAARRPGLPPAPITGAWSSRTKHPQARMRMIDGFNEDWIGLDGDCAEHRNGRWAKASVIGRLR